MTPRQTTPRSWTRLRLDDFCVTSSGGTPSRDNPAFYENGSIPWVKSGELAQKIVLETGEKITADALANSSAKMVKPGAILVAMYGATVGQIAVLGIEAATNQAVCAIESDQAKCLPRFLYYSLTQKVPELLQMRVGGAQPNISQKLIRDLKFDVPTALREQARIVELLDQADALRRRRADADGKLARLLPALFRHNFGDPLARTPTTPLRKVLTELKNGTTLAQNDEGKGHRVTRIETISDGTFDLTRTRFIELFDDDLAQWKLEAGDILFSHINSESHLGKAALIPHLPVTVVHGMNLLLLRPNRTEVTPEFLHTLLCTPAVRAFWRTRCRRAVNQASINQSDLSSLTFYLPPLDKQLDFSRRSQNVGAAIAQAAASAAKLETLFQTLLHRAFTGELTAKWREAQLREGVNEMSRAVRT